MSLRTHSDAVPAWDGIRAALRRRVGDSIFDIWIAPLKARRWDGDVLELEAPAGTEGWVSARYGQALQSCARELLGDGTTVTFTEARAEGHFNATAEAERRRRSGAPDALPALPAGPRASFNPRYSFEQFIIGTGNRLAHAAALAVAESPGQAYNPLFLHGPPGLGKTHLLHAIGNYVLAFGAGTTVRYTTAEAFTNHFLGALSTRSVEPFKRAYRDADVLLIDDVQFLASKARTAEEFFHTFNAVYERERQLVLTCDRLPRSLSGVEARLSERFESGLVAEMTPPDLATRIAILRKRAALDRIVVSDPQVLELIADRVQTNIRRLEGALIRIVAHHSLTQRPIDLELATEVLDVLYPVAATDAPTLARVQALVATHYSVTATELVSATRTARVNWPRQVAMHLARELTGAPLQAIGEAFGGRNHGTVLHAGKRVAERVAADHSVAEELRILTSRLRSRHDDRDY